MCLFTYVVSPIYTVHIYKQIQAVDRLSSDRRCPAMQRYECLLPFISMFYGPEANCMLKLEKLAYQDAINKSSLANTVVDLALELLLPILANPSFPGFDNLINLRSIAAADESNKPNDPIPDTKETTGAIGAMDSKEKAVSVSGVNDLISSSLSQWDDLDIERLRLERKAVIDLVTFAEELSYHKFKRFNFWIKAPSIYKLTMELVVIAGRDLELCYQGFRLVHTLLRADHVVFGYYVYIYTYVRMWSS